MYDDPFNVWLLPDEQRRRSRIEMGMAQQFDIHQAHGGSRVTEDGDGAALWAPPGRWKLGALAQLRLLPGLGRVMGWRSLPRVLRGFGTLDRNHPNEPHWYLTLLGVRPDRQGRGIGSALLSEGLEQADRDGVGVYLETANPDNVAFYERHGFSRTSELELREGPTVITMWRDPR